MGRPGSSPLSRPQGDAVSLHSQHVVAGASAAAFAGRRGFLDADDDAPELFLDDDDELPPLYSDVIEADLAAENAADDGDASVPLMAGDALRRPAVVHNVYASADVPCGTSSAPQPWRYCIMPIDGAASTQAMVDAVAAWCARPPRPYVQLRGTHSETHDNNGKRESREVVDFDVKVELTPYLYSNPAEYASWRAVQTADNYKKVHRGTVFRHAAPGVKCRPRAPVADLEQGALPHDGHGQEQEEEEEQYGYGPKPTVREWCARFCEDASPLRSFAVQRRMTGFDYAKVKSQMEVLVRRTSYHGHLSVGFPVDEAGIVCYNDHAFNRWRVQRWIQVLCALTLMIVFTWPYLFFRTRKYDVVAVEWPFSRLDTEHGRKEYVSLSEDQWYNMWARAITKGVLSKRQGTLDQEDLRQAEGADPTFAPTGSAHADGALGFVRAGISAMNQVNRQLGWGGDC